MVEYMRFENKNVRVCGLNPRIFRTYVTMKRPHSNMRYFSHKRAMFDLIMGNIRICDRNRECGLYVAEKVAYFPHMRTFLAA